MDADGRLEATGAVATRGGTGRDAAMIVYCAPPGRVAAAVVAGCGTDPDDEACTAAAVQAAAQAGARNGARAGLAAAQSAEADIESGSGLVAVAAACPGRPTEVACAGGCRVYGWTGTRLRRYADAATGADGAEISGPLVILATADLDGPAARAELAALTRRSRPEPQALADVLADAAAGETEQPLAVAVLLAG